MKIQDSSAEGREGPYERHSTKVVVCGERRDPWFGGLTAMLNWPAPHGNTVQRFTSDFTRCSSRGFEFSAGQTERARTRG